VGSRLTETRFILPEPMMTISTHLARGSIAMSMRVYCANAETSR